MGNWVLPEENAEGEGDPLHPNPDEGPVEVGLHHAGLALLQLKRVKEPEGEVEEGQEGDGLDRIIFSFRNSIIETELHYVFHLSPRATHLTPLDFLRKLCDFSAPPFSPWQAE